MNPIFSTMIIDTKKRVISIQLRRFLTLIGLMLVIMLVFIILKLPNTFLGFNKYNWALILGIIYVISAVAEAFFEYTYILFSDEGDLIVLRYFSLSFFNKKKQSVEIPKSEFTSYTIKESLWGLKKKISLQRFYKNTEANYPFVPLTILKKDELDQILKSLDTVCKK